MHAALALEGRAVAARVPSGVGTMPLFLRPAAARPARDEIACSALAVAMVGDFLRDDRAFRFGPT
jgi:hypothetical protein